MDLVVEDHGRITVKIDIGEVKIQDRFYPFCGNATETAAVGQHSLCIRTGVSGAPSSVYNTPKVE